MKKTNIRAIFLAAGMMLSTFTINAQIQKGLDIDGLITYHDYSGGAVSMPNSSFIAIGAPRYGNFPGAQFPLVPPQPDGGRVRVYSWNGTVWNQKGADLVGQAFGNEFGGSVSMPDGNTVAVGARFNSANGNGSGHVRVSTWNGTTWVTKGVELAGEAANDQSGCSVSMPNASFLAIGAPGNDGGGADAGHVRVYTWNSTAWIQKGLDIDGEAGGDQSGYSVSMPNGNTLAVGAPYNGGFISGKGQVRVYTWSGTAWVQKGVDIDGEAAGDRSGWSVSMPDGNTVAVGARNNSANGIYAGHVRIYTWSGTAWVQKGVDIDGEAANDQSGYSVSMPDANTVAIGAQTNSANGNGSGHARVYTWRGSSWVQRGVDIDGEAVGDRSGWSVSMPDGNTVAIGAPLNSNSFSTGTLPISSGHARVYSVICGDSIQLQPQSFTSFVNSGLANFTCKSTDTAAGYQWQENIGSGWSNLTNQGIYSGTASDSLILTGVTPSMNNYGYRCIVYSCSIDTSGVAMLYVTCPDSLRIQPQNFTAFSSIGLAHFMCKSTDTAATYQWQENTGSGWANLSNLGNYTGVMVDSLVISGVTSSMNNYGYRCIITSGCMTDTSGIAYLTVVDDLGFGESKLNELSISPNPTNRIMTLNVEFVGTYELLTLDGRVLEYGKARQEYDLSAYPKAVYNLRLSTDEGVRVLKVVKN